MKVPDKHGYKPLLSSVLRDLFLEKEAPFPRQGIFRYE